MIRAGIFDFDGVIVDSERYHHIAWEQLAHDIGVEFDYAEYGPYKSAGRKAVIPYLFSKAGKQLTESEFERCSQLRDTYAKPALAQVSEKDLLPGIVDFLYYLRAQNIKVGVGSASRSSNVVAKRLRLYDLFDVFIDGNDNLPHKPNPDIFLAVASKLGVRSDECVVFEDSANGLKAALNAKMRVIGVQSYFTDIAPVIDNFENLTLQRIEELCTTKF